MQSIEPVLEAVNKHCRDDFLQFDEPLHLYTHVEKTGLKFKSVTTFVHDFFGEFNADQVIANMMRGKKWNSANAYWGMTPEQIKQKWNDNGKQASLLGTILHNNIESFLNSTCCPYPYSQRQLLEKDASASASASASIEWTYFLNYVRDFGDKIPFRTEWRIFDEELRLAGSIDMTYINPEDNSLSIYDWKRSKEIKMDNPYRKKNNSILGHLPDCNFYHYSLQLNAYKAILERTYGYKVKELVLVILHPDFDNYQLVPCADLSKEVQDIFIKRLEDA